MAYTERVRKVVARYGLQHGVCRLLLELLARVDVVGAVGIVAPLLSEDSRRTRRYWQYGEGCIGAITAEDVAKVLRVSPVAVGRALRALGWRQERRVYYEMMRFWLPPQGLTDEGVSVNQEDSALTDEAYLSSPESEDSAGLTDEGVSVSQEDSALTDEAYLSSPDCSHDLLRTVAVLGAQPRVLLHTAPRLISTHTHVACPLCSEMRRQLALTHDEASARALAEGAKEVLERLEPSQPAIEEYRLDGVYTEQELGWIPHVLEYIQARGRVMPYYVAQHVRQKLGLSAEEANRVQHLVWRMARARDAGLQVVDGAYVERVPIASAESASCNT